MAISVAVPVGPEATADALIDEAHAACRER